TSPRWSCSSRSRPSRSGWPPRARRRGGPGGRRRRRGRPSRRARRRPRSRRRRRAPRAWRRPAAAGGRTAPPAGAAAPAPPAAGRSPSRTGRERREGGLAWRASWPRPVWYTSGVDDLESRILEGRLDPVYLLAGTDPLLYQRVVAALTRAVVNDATR